MKLLLVEDQESLARPVSMVLEHNGFACDIAYDGNEALSMLRTDEYDGVLLDVMIPQVTGWEVLAQIRAEGNQVPVMMITALDSLDDKVRGLEGGADDYLTKPFEMREMVARVRAMTRTRTVETSNTLAMGDLTLRRSSSELMSDGVGSFRLTSKEFRMAEMLAHGNGHPIPTVRFAEKLWPNDDMDDPDMAIGLYASYLSNKMRALHSSKVVSLIGGGWALVDADGDDEEGHR